MELIYGIDLGTSNCLAAKAVKFLKETRVDCLKDSEGNISFPSVIHFASEDEVTIGDSAKVKLPDYPESTLELVKVRMGKETSIPFTIRGQEIRLSPQEISARLLKHFNVIHNNQIKKVVLSVPAYFDENQKNATLQAGQISGIDIVELIEEPSAAIMYHLFDSHKRGNGAKLKLGGVRNYLVFDFGGGTLDLSLVKVELDQLGNVKPTVLLKGGDPELGGNNIDFAFTELMLEYLEENHEDEFIAQAREVFEYYQTNKRFEPKVDDKVKTFIMRLKTTLEYAKIKLSEETKFLIEFGNMNYEDIYFSRQDFEENVLDNVARIRVISVVKSLLSKIEKARKIDELVFVGGSSQIPYFKKLIENTFPQFKNKIVISKEYDNAIAKGAAILGAIKSGIDVEPFGSNRCLNVISHNILVEHKVGATVKDTVKLVNAGMPFPFEKPQSASFKVGFALDRSIKIMLKEECEKFNKRTEERELLERTIANFKFYHPFFYTGDEITISLTMSEQGLYFFKATHETGEFIDFVSEKLYQLDERKLAESKIKVGKMKEK